MRTLRHLSRFAVLAVTAFSLSACFDLDQKIAIHRDGSGSYQVTIAAEGGIGEALKNDKKGNGNFLKPNKAAVTVAVKDGKVVKTARVDFKSLGDLSLQNESASMTVLGHDWFGLGPAHVRFRRVFLVNEARAKQTGGKDDDAGQAALAAIFGNHTYTFAVSLPGSVDRVAPVKINGIEVKPDVTGDFYNGHTITWKMPLTMLMESKSLVFEADFSAYGSFA